MYKLLSPIQGRLLYQTGPRWPFSNDGIVVLPVIHRNSSCDWKGKYHESNHHLGYCIFFCVSIDEGFHIWIPLNVYPMQCTYTVIELYRSMNLTVSTHCIFIYILKLIVSDLLLLFVTCLPCYNFLHPALFLLATVPFTCFFGECWRSGGPTNLFSAQDLGLVTCRGQEFLLITRMLGQYI